MEDRDFEALRRVLALKRYEQPPPGYFFHLPDRIISRIESEAVLRREPWWSRWLPVLDLKPALACFYGGAIGCLMLWTVNYNPEAEASVMISPGFGPALGWAASIAATTIPASTLGVETASAFPAHALDVYSNSQSKSSRPVFDRPPAFLLNGGSTLEVQTVRFDR